MWQKRMQLQNVLYLKVDKQTNPKHQTRVEPKNESKGQAIIKQSKLEKIIVTKNREREQNQNIERQKAWHIRRKAH